MQSISDIFTKKGIRFAGTRLLLCGLALVIYLLLWRPMRVAVTERLVYPQVASIDDSRDSFSASLSGGALLIKYTFGDVSKRLQYRPQFGFFFLVTLMALFFVSDFRRHYFLLGGLHLAATILTYLFLMIGATGFQSGFLLTDAISGYLAPALSLALVPLVVKGMIE